MEERADGLRRVLNIVKHRWTVLLGVLMIVLGAYMLWIKFDEADITYILAQIVMVIFGIVMLLNPVRTVMNNVAIYALGLGLSRMIKGLPYILSADTAVFLVGCGIMFIGASLTYTGVMFLKGKARGYRRMIYTSSLVFFVMVYLVTFLNYGIPFKDLPFVDRDVLLIETALMCLLYGCLAFVLIEDSIISRGYYEAIENDLRHLGTVTNLPADLSVSESTAHVLMDRDDWSWHSVDDGGPVETEYSFDIDSSVGTLHATAQIWKGESRMFFTITDTASGTMMQAARFGTDDMYIDSGVMTLIARDGFMARFRIQEARA